VKPEKPEITLARIERKIDLTLSALGAILRKEQRLMASIDEILTDVAELPTINDSLDALFVQLQALIEAGKTDPAKLQQAHDLIVAQKERTKAAIVANTPVA
jgi:hypothetical protein